MTVALTIPLLALGCAKAEDQASAGDKASAKTEAPKDDSPVPEKKEAKAKDPHEVEGVKGKLSPDDVETLLEDGKAHVFDANSEKTRKKFGVVPGAKLLTSYKDYDLGILPEDKASKLVFYCSNLQCSAAGKGAKRAVVAGYTDVNLMPQGIMGWADSGKDVKKL